MNESGSLRKGLRMFAQVHCSLFRKCACFEDRQKEEKGSASKSMSNV